MLIDILTYYTENKNLSYIELSLFKVLDKKIDWNVAGVVGGILVYLVAAKVFRVLRKKA